MFGFFTNGYKEQGMSMTFENGACLSMHRVGHKKVKGEITSTSYVDLVIFDRDEIQIRHEMYCNVKDVNRFIKIAKELI